MKMMFFDNLAAGWREFLVYKHCDLLFIKHFYKIRTCYIVNQSDPWYEIFH